jgi:prepilin-type N-terminal cleavage/methylation domain-containing protein
MLKGARGRRGFTLIETVVTVGIVATLAAVVVPQVVKQFDLADPARVAEDLNNIRTGIEVFAANVKSQPGDLEDLANQIGDFGANDPADRDSSIQNFPYSTADSLAWRGPYIGANIDSSAHGSNADVLTTGFGVPINNSLRAYDIDAADGGATVAHGNTAADFVAIQIDDLNTTAFRAVNEILDGASETTDADRAKKGRFRCPAATYASGISCYYLATPIK